MLDRTNTDYQPTESELLKHAWLYSTSYLVMYHFKSDAILDINQKAFNEIVNEITSMFDYIDITRNDIKDILKIVVDNLLDDRTVICQDVDIDIFLDVKELLAEKLNAKIDAME